MAIVIKSNTKELKYTPLSQANEEKPFRAIVKPVSSKDLLILEDKVVRRTGEDISFGMGEYSFNILKASLIGWENITDEDGKELEFKKSSDGIPLDSTIAALGVELIQEISNVVSAISRDSSKIQIFFPEQD